MWKKLNRCGKTGIIIGSLFLIVGLLCSIGSGLFINENYLLEIPHIPAVFIQAIGSSQVGGWMQAIGSVAAVFVAIWVINRQHEAQIERDMERERIDERNLLFSIKNELEVFFENTKPLRESIEKIR